MERLPGEMFITVIVSTHNRAGLLAGCLQSLADQTMPVEQYDVVVVENACTDQTSSVVEGFARSRPNFRSVRDPQPGKSRALNAGLRYARGSHVAFIDDDARAPRPWVEQIARAFSNTAPTPAVVAGKIKSIYERPPPAWWEPVTEQSIRKPGFLKPGWDLYCVAGSNLAFDKEALLDCGGFAVHHGPVGKLFRLGEDTEAVVRVAARSPAVWYDPNITVEHWVPAQKMTFRYLIWRKYLSGVATSKIQKFTLLSFRTLVALLTLPTRPFRRNGGGSAAQRGAGESCSSRPLRGALRVQVSMLRGALWVAEKAGRFRGARLLS